MYSWGFFKDCRYFTSLLCFIFPRLACGSCNFLYSVYVYFSFVLHPLLEVDIGIYGMLVISSDRFVDLSPNSVDALLKVGYFSSLLFFYLPDFT